MLKMNDIGTTGAKMLADSLIDNNKLKELDISHNKIENEGGIHIASMLQVSQVRKCDKR